jgi:putative endonuclease
MTKSYIPKIKRFVYLGMYFCYILYSEKLNKYYIGSTADPIGRLQRHNTSKKGFTATGKPWALKYTEQFENKQLAMKRELQLKKWKNRQRLEELIRKGSEHPDAINDFSEHVRFIVFNIKQQ